MAQMCFGFSEHTSFLRAHQLATFRNQWAMLGEHSSQKVMRNYAYNPLFWPKKPPPGGRKMGQFFLAISVNRPIKPLGKIFQTQKTGNLFSSELQEFEVWICVHPNFPIIILILLNGFHKLAISMGLNTCVGIKPPSTSNGRYLLNIHFIIELDQKVIQFNIQFKY